MRLSSQVIGATISSLLLVLPIALAFDDFQLEPGYSLVFNGKNLDGWRQAKGKKESLDGQTQAYKGRFKVLGGKLVYDPAVKGDVYIETVREFAKDVHVKLDFRPGPKCNNDFFLRGTKFDIIPGNKENKNVKEDSWHTFEIIVTGESVEHKIDGTVVRASKAKSKSSPLMLRAEFGALEIKNIRVKE